jgi:hypothetical protein
MVGQGTQRLSLRLFELVLVVHLAAQLLIVLGDRARVRAR